MTRSTIESSHAVLLASAASVLLHFQPGTAWAQDVVPVEESRPAEAVRGQIGEIVVTARRREESLQSVPVAVAAFSERELKNRSIVNAGDLSGVAPNLTVQSGPSGNSSTGNFIVRGIGQFDFLPTYDTGTGLYVDGVYVSGSAGSILDLASVERVEVLRGPQGTLFGRNAIGGAINITTQAPKDYLSAEFSATTGSRSRFDAQARLDAPVAPNLAGTISLVRRNQDGYTKRRTTGEEQGNTDLWGGRAAILYDSGDFKLRLSGDYTKTDERSQASAITSLEPSNPQFGALIGFGYVTPASDGGFSSPFLSSSGDYSNSATGPNYSTAEIWGLATTAEAEIGAVTLKSITAYRESETTAGSDGDGSPLIIFEQTSAVKIKQFSQELQLLGESGRLNWVVGAYYFDSTSDVLIDIGLFGIAAIGGSPFLATTNKLDSKSYAIFGSGTYALTDRLNLSLGARFSHDRKDFVASNDFVALGLSGFTDENGIPAPLGTRRAANGSWNDFSPKVSLEFKASPDAFFYASVSRGYKAGSFNGRGTANPGTGVVVLRPESYGPERATAYEIGAKLDLLDRRLRVNSAVFQTDISDSQQLAGQTIGGDPPQFVNSVTNIGDARIRGAEIELVAIPLRGLALSGSVGYLDNEFTKVRPNALNLSEDTRFYGAPKWSLTGSAQYEFDVGTAGSLTLRADVNYRSLIYYQIPNVGAIDHRGELQEGYALLNLRATFTSRNDRFSVALFGTNVTDKYYSTFRNNTFGLIQSILGKPAEWGVTGTVRF